MRFLLKKLGYEDFIKPDVILLDLDLLKKCGLQVLREIKLNQP